MKIPLAVLSLALLSSAAADPAPSSIWGNPAAKKPQPDPRAALLPLISVRGNRFVDPSGAPVLFRGVSIVDPDNCLERGFWGRPLFAALRADGANLVRIPVHPAAWRRQGPEAYTALLDQAVGWCSELGLHVIVDWHSIGNLCSSMYQEPIYDTTIPETFDFWRRMAAHFKGNTTVAFFELFNEPTHEGGKLGPMTWTQWRELNEQMIGIIRASNQDVIPLVAGFDWAYDLGPIRYDPVQASGIGYVTHPYPFKRSQPWEPRWEEDYAFAAERYPVIATEIGFAPKPGEVAGSDDYGNRITRFLEQRGISWVAWVFDDKWWPALLQDHRDFSLNAAGTFFRDAMQRPPAPIPEKPAGRP